MTTNDAAAGGENTGTETTQAGDAGAGGDAATNTSTETSTAEQSTETSEGQGQGGGQAEGEGDTPELEAEGAPEKYEPFKLPEGLKNDDYISSPELMEGAMKYAKEQNWSQEKAQGMVDLFIKFQPDFMAAHSQMLRGLWAEESEREFGAGFQSIATGAQRAIALAEKGRPGITERLDKTNLGNHPDVLWLFNKLGELSKDGKLIGMGAEPSPTQGAPKSREEILYGNTK